MDTYHYIDTNVSKNTKVQQKIQNRMGIRDRL